MERTSPKHNPYLLSLRHTSHTHCKHTYTRNSASNETEGKSWQWWYIHHITCSMLTSSSYHRLHMWYYGLYITYSIACLEREWVSEIVSDGLRCFNRGGEGYLTCEVLGLVPNTFYLVVLLYNFVILWYALFLLNYNVFRSLSLFCFARFFFCAFRFFLLPFTVLLEKEFPPFY